MLSYKRSLTSHRKGQKKEHQDIANEECKSRWTKESTYDYLKLETGSVELHLRLLGMEPVSWLVLVSEKCYKAVLRVSGRVHTVLSCSYRGELSYKGEDAFLGWRSHAQKANKKPIESNRMEPFQTPCGALFLVQLQRGPDNDSERWCAESQAQSRI